VPLTCTTCTRLVTPGFYEIGFYRPYSHAYWLSSIECVLTAKQRGEKCQLYGAVFSATYCPFSAAAKAALRAEGVPFTAVEWNKTPGGGGFAPALVGLPLDW
jgi:hypothetical protein